MCITFTHTFGNCQHLSGQISSFACSSSSHLVSGRRLTPLICPAWKYECCWWCSFGALLAWGWGRNATASPAPLDWDQDQECARDAISSLAKDSCSASDTEPRWCFMAFSDGLQPVVTTAHSDETLRSQWHSQGHLLPVSISPCCLPVPPQGLAVPPCRSLVHHGAAGLLPSASGLLPYLQVTFSALWHLFWDLGYFLHGTVVHRWLSQCCSSAVVVTSSVPFNFCSWVICVSLERPCDSS